MIDLRTTRLLAGLAAGVGALALALPPLAAPAPTSAPQEGAAQDEESEEHGPLHDAMETLQSGMRTLRRSMSDPEQKEEATALVQELQLATLVAFQHAPAPVEPLEGEDLVRHSAEFRKRILAVCEALVDMEVAIQTGDADAAKEIYRTLGGYKKEGHDLFIE